MVGAAEERTNRQYRRKNRRRRRICCDETSLRHVDSLISDASARLPGRPGGLRPAVCVAAWRQDVEEFGCTSTSSCSARARGFDGRQRCAAHIRMRDRLSWLGALRCCCRSRVVLRGGGRGSGVVCLLLPDCPTVRPCFPPLSFVFHVLTIAHQPPLLNSKRWREIGGYQRRCPADAMF